MAVFVATRPINPPALAAAYANADANVVQVGNNLRIDVTGPQATVNLIGDPNDPLYITFGFPYGTVKSANLLIGGQLQFTITGSVALFDMIAFAFPTINIPGAIEFVLKGNDTVTGANVVGVDLLGGYNGNDTIQGRAGNDRIDGGLGTDTVSYAEKAVGISLTLGAGAAAAIQKAGVTGALGGNAVGGTNEDTVKNVENVTGGTKNDFIAGNAGANKLLGGGGNDTLRGNGGNDILDGGVGNDFLVGGTGKDTQTGGLGNDKFRFDAANHSAAVAANADVINDFDKSGNDIIDLTGFAGTLAYRGTAAFTGANQVRINDIGGPDLLVEINTGGSLAADSTIRLKATTAASMAAATDFDLV